VVGAVPSNLADKPFQRRLDLFDIGVSVVCGEIEDRQMPASDHLAKDRLPPAATEQTEPTSARLHMSRLDDPRIGKVSFEAFDHLGGIFQTVVFQPGAGQNGVVPKDFGPEDDVIDGDWDDQVYWRSLWRTPAEFCLRTQTE